MLIDLIFIFGVIVFVSCAFISILYILYRGAKEKKIRLPSALPDGTSVRWYGAERRAGQVLVIIPLM